MTDDEFGTGASDDPDTCTHPSSDGIDQEDGPAKVWACSSCGWLHHVIPDPAHPGAVRMVPAGSLLDEGEVPVILRLPAALVRDLSETEFQTNVVRVAKRNRWLVNHVYPCRVGRKTRTPTSYKGFPDLTLVHRDGRVIFLELKKVGGEASVEQRRWIAYAQQGGKASNVRAFVAGPRDWPEVHALLSQPWDRGPDET